MNGTAVPEVLVIDAIWRGAAVVRLPMLSGSCASAPTMKSGTLEVLRSTRKLGGITEPVRAGVVSRSVGLYGTQTQARGLPMTFGPQGVIWPS